MKLTIFDSDSGDCLLLEAGTGELVLCDGGMSNAMKHVIRHELGTLARAQKELALVYVSHIDNDHIGGVLQLLLDEAEWRVFDLHERQGDPIREPTCPRPPRIKGILHNGFSDLLTRNNATLKELKKSDVDAWVRDVEELLASATPVCYATGVPEFVDAANEMQAIATGIPEALKLVQLASVDALDIPINQPPGVAESVPLLRAGLPGERFAIGSMQFTLIGPSVPELQNLGAGWNTWLRNNKAQVAKIRQELKRRIEAFGTCALVASPYDLRGWNEIPDYKGVTAPNVASLMFVIEEGDKRILLTGDGQQDYILRGLERTGYLSSDGNDGVHFDVLKVQHHGSEHNLDAEFARRVSADHYVFCGNGEHGNPEEVVLQQIVESRLGKMSLRTLALEAEGRDFHFWFSTTSAAAPDGAVFKETFAQREKAVEKLQKKAKGRLHVHFNLGASIELPV